MNQQFSTIIHRLRCLPYLTSSEGLHNHNYDDIDDKLPHLFQQKLENNDTLQIINFSIESFQKEAFMIVSIEFLE